MSDQSTALTPPILVSTKEARRLLGMCHAVFWQKAARGAFGERVGPPNKRYWFYKNLERYADGLKRRDDSNPRKSK